MEYDTAIQLSFVSFDFQYPILTPRSGERCPQILSDKKCQQAEKREIAEKNKPEHH